MDVQHIGPPAQQTPGRDDHAAYAHAQALRETPVDVGRH